MKKIVRLTESDLNKIVRRVLKESKEDFIEKISKSLVEPYFKDLINLGIEIEYWVDVLSQLFNEKVGIGQEQTFGVLLVYDENNNIIYRENIPDGYDYLAGKRFHYMLPSNIVDYICGIMNPSYPSTMTEDERDERFMDWGEIIVWGEGDIGDTDDNILINFLCVDEEEYEDNEDFFVGDLNIDERFLDMVLTINPNLSRSNIIPIIKECFLDVFQKEESSEIVINSVHVV
jgi:hypothetical protein